MSPPPEIDREDFKKFLGEIPLFKDLDALARDEVRFVARRFTIPAGQTLFRQGDDPDAMYLLKNGEVSIARRLPGDESLELARLGPGSVIGEMGMLDRSRRSASAIAIEECSGYAISFERFELLRSNFGHGAFAVMQCFVAEVIRRTRALISEMRTLVEATPELAPGILSELASMGASNATQTTGPTLPDADVLARLPFFRRLSRDELAAFTSAHPLRRFPRNAIVFSEGDPGEECYVVVRGALALSFERGDRYLRIGLLGPGSVAGEVALWDGKPRACHCRAREETFVLVVNRERFERLRAAEDPTAFKLIEAIAGGAADLLRKANGHVAWMRPERAFAAEHKPDTPADATGKER
jgi:CRP/FNR family transcriptional regulator, cyclic AMP receptor protein